MTNKQLEHYLKGGRFSAIYNPSRVDDLNKNNFLKIGKKIEVHQSSNTFPMEIVPYQGQFIFNSNDIFGWIPEEDLEDLTITDAYMDNPQPLPKYVYRLTYDREGQLDANFGLNHNLTLPLKVIRQYDELNDEYVKNLSKPQATSIERCIWDGSKIKWETILGQLVIDD